MERRSRDAGLGGVLGRFRQAANLTQHELAALAGLSLGAIRDLEQGRTRRPADATVAALVTALGLNSAQAGQLERAAATRGTWVQVLGPLTVWRDGVEMPTGGPARRAVLGLLALSAGSSVHRTTIIDVLWPDSPPGNAVQLVQADVSRIRKTLAAGDSTEGEVRLSSSGASYRLQAGTAQLDLLRFGQLTADARAADSRGDRIEACRLYEQAIGLWQGDVLADVELLRGYPAVTGLARQRTEAVIGYARAASAAGKHDLVLPMLRELTGREPLNEHGHAQLMFALAGSGLQAEALKVYHDLSSRLDDELGMPPGPDLSRAYQLVLRQEIPAWPAISVPRPPSPPDWAPQVVPRQMPAGPRQFTGRARELKEFSALLDDAYGAGAAAAVAVVSGTAGVGKTALAVHWAHRAADRFPDGQLYADLHGWGPSADPVSPADAIGRFLGALGVPADQVPADTGARQDLYRSLLARRRMLIVLDNARDATQVRPLLPGSASCMVLVTSRAQFAPLVAFEGAHPVSLEVLTAAEAVELLASRLGPERLAAEPDAARDLADSCAHLPLALAITASRVALRPGMTLATLATELRSSGEGLAAFEAGEGASVEAVFAWSYRCLAKPTRQMFRQLGLHPGPDITARAAASLTGSGFAAARTTLAKLAEASMLTEHFPGRYRFHDLLRAYAAGRACAEDNQPSRHAATHRFLDHYLHSAHAADQKLRKFPADIAPDPPQPGVTPEQFADFQEAMNWFGAEHDVLAALADHAASSGFDIHGWQLPLTLGGFFDRNGHTARSAAIQRSALAAAQRLGDQQAQAQIHRRIGSSLVRLGSPQEAEHHYQQALDLCRELGDHSGEARAHLGLGFAADHQGRHRDALEHAARTLALSRQLADPAFLAAALNNVGWCHARLGEYEEALAHCQDAITLHHDLGDRYNEAHAWDSVGYAYRHLGQHADAVSSYQRALALFRAIDARADEAITLDYLGDTHLADGNPHLAVQSWQQALLILTELRHPRAQEIRGKLGLPGRPP